MKRKLLLFVVLAMVLSLALTACVDREVTKLAIVDGTFEYEYEKDSTPDFSGLKVTATYSDGKTREVTADKLELSELDTSTTGKKEFTITYGGKSLTVEVTVKKTEAPIVVTLDKVEIDVTSVLSKVKVGSTYSTADIKATATYSDNTTKALTLADLTVTAPDTATAGAKKLAISYTEGEKTVNAEMDVTVVGVKTLTLLNAPAYIMKGAAIDTSAITANAVYTDDTAEALANDKLTFAAFATNEVGAKTLTATYLDGTGEAAVAVVEPIAINISGIGAFTTGIPDGQEIDRDAVKAAASITVDYGYGSTTVISAPAADLTDLEIDDVEVGGNRYLKFTYLGVEKSIQVIEGAATVESIVINFGTAKNYVALGKEYATAGITLTAIYTNGTTESVTEGFTFDALSTAAAGEATLTAHYEDMTATATVYVLPVSSVVLNAGIDLQVMKNGILDTSAAILTVTYSNGTYTETDNNVSISEMTTGAIATDVAGNKSFTVTYKDATGNVPYLVYTEASIAVNGSVSVNKGETPDLDNLTFTVTYTNGDTATVSGSEVTVLDADFANKFNTEGTVAVAISYGDATGSFNVTVLNYAISGIEQPDFVNVFQGTRKDKFLKNSADTVYVVGDDNDFIYKLKVSWVDETNAPISLTNYTGYSKVYIIDGGSARLLEGAEFATYVEYIDEHSNAFNFTQAAVGKTFRIDTIPAAAKEFTSFTQSLTVKVVDGWNIYSAKELNILTNYNDFGFQVNTVGQKNQLQVAYDFLDANGIARPAAPIAGMVVHGDITITRNDIPADYFMTVDGETFISDNFSVFPHTVDYYNEASGKYEFTFHGNFFTIYSYNVPIITPSGTWGDTTSLGLEKSDGISSSQLFKFNNENRWNDAADGAYDHTLYYAKVENLYMMDDNPNDPLGGTNAPDRAKRGAMGIKMSYIDMDIDNTIIERYYISLFPDKAYVNLDLDYVKLHNAWQNHIMPYADNELQSYFNPGIASGDAGAIAGDENIYVNITNSQLTECGGPVIFSQTEITDDGGNTKAFNTKIRTDVVTDSATKMYAYVTADSIWFKTFGATDYMKQIQNMDALFNAYGNSFRVMNPLAGYNGQFINLLYVNMGNSFGATATTSDVDGTFTIGGQKVMNMNEDNAALEVLKNTPAPVFQSPAAVSGNETWNSSICFYQAGSTVMLTNDFTSLTSGKTPAALSGNTHPIFSDDQLVMYYIGMGIVFGDYHAHNAAGDAYCKPAT